MHISFLVSLLSLTAATASSSLNTSILFSNAEAQISGIPSVYESTLQARRILHLSKIATVATVFPTIASQENRPRDVAGAPIGQMEYFASCGPQVYNPSLIGVTITTTMKNAAAGSNVSLSLRYHVPSDAPAMKDPWAYLPANLPRIALIGYIEQLDDKVVKEHGIRDCFIKTHPEATIWEPGTDIHESWWGRLVVKEVYFFGGFGDRARITWLPIEVWQSITQDEVEKYRMIGEKGYKPNQLEGSVVSGRFDL